MNYPGDMQQKMDAMDTMAREKERALKMATQSQQGLGMLQGLGVLSVNTTGQPPRDDRPPVEVSVGRLMQRLDQLRTQVDVLTGQLAPVLRPDTTAGSDTSKRAPSECALVDGLEAVSEGMERLIAHLSMTRARLCI